MYPHVDETPVAADAADRAAACTTSSTTRTTTRLLREAARAGLPDDRRPRDARRPGAGAVPVVDRRAAAGRRHAGGRAEAACGVHDAMKITSFEEFKELARRGTFVPVCKEIVADLLTPVSAFLKIAEHADYAFLLESVEGGEHVGPLLVPRQGSVPDPARARRPDDDRARRRRSTESDQPFIDTLRRLMADFRSPFVPGPAAVHRRRGRLSRLRRGVVVRAGARRSRRRPPTAPTRPASCCSTRCWPSITCSTAS